MSAQFASVIVTRPYEQVVRQIEEKIVSGQFVRGQKLPTERELGQSFGVSRGVVRDAMKVLGTMGLVEARQGSGIYVRHDPIPTISRALTLSVTPDQKSVLSLFEFREPLEALAAERAAQRRSEWHLEVMRREVAAAVKAAAALDLEAHDAADQRFHSVVAEAADNPYLSAVTNSIRQMQCSVVRLITQQGGLMGVASEQHARISEAIASGSSTEAAAAMREHVRYFADNLCSILKEDRFQVPNLVDENESRHSHKEGA